MKTKNRPLYRKLLFPMLVLILVEIALLAGSVFGGGLIEHMENNEMKILHERVVNRQRYLQTEMLTRWSKVDSTAQQINAATEQFLQSGELFLNSLDDGSVSCLALLDAATDPLIKMLRDNGVTGAFLVLNTDDLQKLSEQGIYLNKPGIYIRDYDPDSNYSNRNMDLLMEYAPSEVVKRHNISLDTGWKPQFEFESAGEYASYLYEPYQAAVYMEERLELEISDMGYWSEAHCLYGDDQEMISYSVPLILSDGTVYGVLGVDLSLSYLETLLPAEELKDAESGSYLLGINKTEDTQNTVLTNVLINGDDYGQVNGDSKITEIYRENGRSMIVSTQKDAIYCDVEYITLYNTNTPFAYQRWALVGIIRGKNLFVFSENVKKVLMRGILATLFAGVLGGILISIYISRPITALTESVRKMKPFNGISFPRTGIREIDLMAGELEHLNQETLYTAERFSYIINAANLHLALFEVNSEENSVFITGKFFEMLHMEERDFWTLTEREFWSLLEALDRYRQDKRRGDLADTRKPKTLDREKEVIYKFSGSKDGSAKVSYIQITLNRNGRRCIGLVEDITEAFLEKERIEYERDHDLLCGLLNRRAFNRIMSGMFKDKARNLGIAALVMVDLDGLKKVNDTYGHEYGDKYIQTAAQCFVRYTPKNTLICRRSGDEFHLFFYGYKTKEEIRRLICSLQEGIKGTKIYLPDRKEISLRMSAGIAWYPDDSVIYQKLKTYADHAMYQIKHGSKDQFGEFDKDKYLKDQL